DDGVGGGDRPALARGDQQPQCRTEQGGHHDVGEVLRVEVHAVQVDDAGADGVGDVTAGDQRTTDLEDGGDEQRLLDGQCLRTDRGTEGVRDVVTADVERHEHSEEDRDDQDPDVRRLRHEVHGPP